jgi:hypothetical protein
MENIATASFIHPLVQHHFQFHSNSELSPPPPRDNDNALETSTTASTTEEMLWQEPLRLDVRLDRSRKSIGLSIEFLEWQSYISMLDSWMDSFGRIFLLYKSSISIAPPYHSSEKVKVSFECIH